MNDKINGRTPEEIKKGLECGYCEDCSYREYRGRNCTGRSRADALAYIQRLEEKVALYDEAVADAEEFQKECDEVRQVRDGLSIMLTAAESAFETVKRERDAAVEGLTTACTSGNPCLVCSHYRPERSGLEKCELNGWVCSWEWRGKQGWTQGSE